MANMKFSLGGQSIDAVKNWMDMRFKMQFDDNVQPWIELDEFIFVNEQVIIIDNHINDIGIFEGLPLVISLEEGVEKYTFNLLVDLTTLKIDSPVQYRAKVKLANGMNQADERMKAVSYGYLEDQQVIGKGDYVNVPVVIKEKFDTLENLVIALTLFVIIKTVNETYKDTAEKLMKAAKIPFSAGATAAATFEAIITVLYIIAYWSLTLIAVLKLLRELQKNLIPVATHYKGITIRKGLQKALEYFGYTLDTDIGDFDKFVYLPSKTDNKVRTNARDEGIPNVSDYGYQVIEMFELAFMLTNSKYTIIDRTFYIRNKNSSFWHNMSTNEMPSNIAMEPYRYNAFEMFANKLVHFQYDSSDSWTMPSNKEKDDYSIGTNFEAIVDYENGGNNLAKMQKGLQEINIPLALGKRRDKLSATEVYMKLMVSGFDLIIRIFGGKTLTSQINEHRGRLVISGPSFNVAKLIYLDNGFIPANHRTVHLSARAIYEKYYSQDSFVNNPTRAQRLLFDNIKIPFNFTQFVKYMNNPFFKIQDDGSAFGSKNGKITMIEGNIAGDVAIADYYIEQQYNKVALTEKWIES